MNVFDAMTGILFAVLFTVCASENWSYQGPNGPAQWKYMQPPNHCGGSEQSPIDIVTDRTKFRKTPPLKFFGYKDSLGEMNVLNRFYTMKLSGFGGIKRSITGANLEGRYILDSFHIHWGQDQKVGSEHTIDGKRFAAEMHLVHYKSEYGNFSDALEYSDGVGVLAVLLKEVSSTNDHEEEVNDWLANASELVAGHGNVTKTSGDFPLRDLLPPTHQKRYYTYHGSFTTPSCDEDIKWIVFHDPIKISSYQMKRLRQFRDEEGKAVDHSWRPTQPLNGRKVFRSWK